MWDIITTTIPIVLGIVLGLLIVVIGLVVAILVGVVIFVVMTELIWRVSGKRWPRWVTREHIRWAKVKEEKREK